MVGRTVAHYELGEKLGEGGMGVVYRARDTRLNRHVAIKVLPDSFAGSRERKTRFEREARLLATLSHPNIAAIYGVEALASDPGRAGARPEKFRSIRSRLALSGKLAEPIV